MNEIQQKYKTKPADLQGMFISKAVLVLLLLLIPFVARGQIQQNRGVLQVRPDAVQRDTKLEREASERHRKITAVLQPEAKAKLAVASRAFQRAYAKSPESTDPYKLARAEVEKHFPGLSTRQSDLLSFYLLAEFAERASNSEGRRKKPEGGEEMSEMTSLRLQMMMDRQSKFMSTLSNIMKKISQTQDTLVQNLK